MPNIETPEDFAAKLSDRQHTALYITSLVVLRDAAIRAEYDALLKTCGEALKATSKIMGAFEYTPDEDSTCNSFFKAKLNEDWFFAVLHDAEKALAAIRKAGVRV